MRSSPRLRILNLGLVSWLDSQAIYHAVATGMTLESADTIIICRPKSPYFCIGYHQNVEHVLDARMRTELGYPVVRRRLGGGVTYLDNQQLFYQSVFHKTRSSQIPTVVYRDRLRQPINMLNNIGINAELQYINEIEVLGRRIAGIGGGLIGEASVVVGNVLNEFNAEVMAHIINSPCAAFREMALTAMLDRITTLKREGQEEHWQELPNLLIEEYRRDFSDAVFIGELSTEERETAEMKAEKMISEEYLTEYQSDVSPRALTRLKISASTSIELVGIKQRSPIRQNFATLKIRDNAIEEVRIADDLDETYQSMSTNQTIRTFDAEQIKVGMNIQQW